MGRYNFRLPDVGEGTAEAEIVKWHVAAGDQVEEDQPLLDVMTDKATVEITSPVSGRVLEVYGVAGDMAAVGSTLVVLEVEGAGNATGTSPQRGREESSAPPPQGEGDRPKSGGGGSATPDVHEPADLEAKTPEPDAGGAGNYLFRLPDVGEGTAEAEVVKWHVKPGDEVTEDQPLVDVMTDKATVEITSPVAGRIVSVHGDPGQMAAVGSTLVVLEVEGVGNLRPGATASPQTAKPEPAAPATSPASRSPSPKGGGSQAQDLPPQGEVSPKVTKGGPSTQPTGRAPGGGGWAPPEPAFTTRVQGERPLASPAVRRRAQDLGIQLQFVPGSGPAGRISHEDLDTYVASGGKGHAPAAAGGGARYVEKTGVEEVRVIGLRRRIAEKMQESKRRIPHFMYAEECDVTELEELRTYLNNTKRPEQPKLTLLPFLIRALVKVLPNYPQINARYDDDAGVVHRSEAVHVGMATQTPNGLIVPVIRHAEARDLWGLAEEIARLAKATREGSATRDELSGSTITLTSLGPLGGLVHAPVINHPEVAIIGPNKIIDRPVVRYHQVVIRKMMNISSSFDHRVVDGWDAASMIQELKGILEHPATLFMD